MPLTPFQIGVILLLAASRSPESHVAGGAAINHHDAREQVALSAAADARTAAADALIAQLPLADVGCLYLDAGGEPVTPDPQSPTFTGLVRHFGAVKGAWPTVSE